MLGMNKRYTAGWPSVKQFSLFEKFSLAFVDKKAKYLGDTLKSFSKFVAVRNF